MGDYFTLDKVLMQIKSLYECYDKTSEFINSYTDKYSITNIYSDRILTSYKSTSYKDFLSILLDRDFADFEVILKARFNDLERLKLLLFSEIAHCKSKEIEFLIDNPFFYDKIRKNYRIILKKLNNFDDDALDYKGDFNEFKLKFEEIIIDGFSILEDDIEDERRSGLYKIIGGSALWGIPIVIGIFQLIAMQFFTLNPYLFMAFYIFVLFMLYIIIGFFNDIKLLYISFKNNIFSIVPFLIPFSMLAPLIFSFSELVRYSNFEILITIFVELMAILMIIVFGKFTIERTKKELIDNELKDLLVKFGISEKYIAKKTNK